jgi:hypothetical protein
MRLAGLNLHIRRIVVDERYRASTAQLSDAIRQALQAELAGLTGQARDRQKPWSSHSTSGQSEIAAVIAGQIGQRLPMSAATRPTPHPGPRQYHSGAPR